MGITYQVRLPQSMKGYDRMYSLDTWQPLANANFTGKFRIWNDGEMQMEIQYVYEFYGKAKSLLDWFLNRYQIESKTLTKWISEKDVRWYETFECSGEK